MRKEVWSFRKLLRMFANGFALTFPLEALGLRIGGYPVTLPFVAVWVLGLALLCETLLGRPLRRGSLVWGMAFICWGLVTLGPGVITADVIPLAICAVLMLPLLGGGSWRTVGLSTGKWFVWGALGTTVVSVFQVLGHSRGTVPWYGSPPVMFEMRTHLVGGIPRASATFLEPSYYAIYLVFAIACLDLGGERFFPRPTQRFFRLWLLAALLSTLSIAGVFLIGVYFGVKSVWRIRSVDPTRNGGVVWLGTRTVKLLLSIVGLLAFARLWPESGTYLAAKLSQAAAQVMDESACGQAYDSSVSIRLGVVGILRNYWRSEGPLAVLTGVGFNRFDDYLRANYAWTGGTALAEGGLPNVYGAVLAGTGLVGLGLYLGWLLSLAPSKMGGVAANNPACWAYYLTWLVAHAATGQLTVYPLLGYAYIGFWNTGNQTANFPGETFLNDRECVRDRRRI